MKKRKFIALPLAVLLIFWLWREPLLSLLAFLTDQEAVIEYLQALGIWGPVMLTLTLSLQVIFAVIPGHILMLTSGYLYGFSGGLALNIVGTIVASQVAFVTVRWLGQPLISRWVPASLLSRWSRIAQKQGFAFFLFFFWFPVVPSNMMNFVAGLSPISFWSFLAANFFGRLPGITLITLIGAYGLELSTWQWITFAVIGLALFFGGRYGAAKLQQRYFGPVSVEGK